MNTMSTTSAKPVKVVYELVSYRMKGVLTFELELRNICLQQDIDLGCWFMQLCMVRDDNTFAERVILRPPSTSQHLKYVLWQQLYPPTLSGL